MWNIFFQSFTNNKTNNSSLLYETVGHKASEYEKLEITADEMPQAMQKEIIIVDGQITFGEDKNPVVLELVIPSEADALTDYIVDVDYRVTMIELGL